MRVKVKLFATFRELAKKSEVQIELEDKSNLRDLLSSLCASYPGLGKELFQESELSKQVIVLKNGRNIIFLDKLKTKLANGDEIAIFPPLGGG
jgi:molybdopterin synthase sulfur carrier subunit